MQNHMPMTTHSTKSKQEIEFQYGGDLFSKTGSSFISTVHWDISSKFGMQIDFHNIERMQSLNLNTEVDFQLYDRHLEKSIWRQKSVDVQKRGALTITVKLAMCSVHFVSWTVCHSIFLLVPLVVYMHAKFLASTIHDIWMESQNSKSTSCDPLQILDLILNFFVSAPHCR